MERFWFPFGVQTFPVPSGFRFRVFPVLVSVAVTDAWLFGFVTSGLNVTFAVTDQNGASPALICWNNTLTLGGPGTLFSCLGDAEPIFTNQRIRLRVEFISGQPIDLFYDGSGVQEDSSITVPVSVPEFGDIVAPVAATGMLVLFLSRRRRRRTR